MIYICIPTHNEQQTVGVVLWKLRQVLTEFPRDYQLIVADDASTDKTAEVLEPYTRVLPLTVIRSERQLGQAAALEMLLREAVRRSEYPKRDVVITLQADFSEEPDDLVPLIKRLEAGADVAVGNKVSKSKEARLRRWSRALAGHFSRGQKWPEGITPFDGYRAYRLYAVKRAIEECGGHRLIRYDGWAAHAELLRHVLPHARRVEVMDVVDRTDRLQRARRERPLAAALQVRRALGGAAAPAGLVGVEELDRIAATASRTRERGVLVQPQSGTSSGGRGGARPRGREPDRSTGERGRTKAADGRGRSAAEGRTRGGRGPADGAPAAKRQGGRRAEPGTGAEPAKPRAQRPATEAEGTAKPRQRQRRPPAADAAAGAAAATPAADASPETPLPEGAEQAPTAARKRRRKRRRGGAGGESGARVPADGRAGEPEGGAAREPAPGAAGEQATDAAGAGAAGTAEAVHAATARPDPAPRGRPGGAVDESGGEGAAGVAEGTEGAVEGTGERKRRRRGGRRGGRGRRRAGSATAGTGEAGTGEDTGSAGGGGASADNVAPPAETESEPSQPKPAVEPAGGKPEAVQGE